MNVRARVALRGDLLDFSAAPAWGDTDSASVRYRPDHWLLVEGGRIAGVQAEAPGEGWPRQDHAGCLILPGFVDTHVHSPQIDVIASYGTELLDWLTTHTFPAEARHADVAHTEAAAAHFLDALLAHGTTSAVVFPTVHRASADALFAAAEARVGRALPEDLKSFLSLVGFGDVGEDLGFRKEFFSSVEEGQFKEGTQFAQDILGNFYAFPPDDGRVLFFSRSEPGFTVLAPSFLAFLEELQRRDYKLIEWVDSVELSPYAWSAA